MEISAQDEQRYIELCGYAFNFARSNAKMDLERMIDAGLNPNLKNHKGDSLLMLAAYHGAYNTAKMLLQKGARVDERNDRGQTPLAGVCFKGDIEMVQLLVANGADIDANNGMGLTPYSFAVLFGRNEVAQFLLKAHPKPSLLKKIFAKILSFFTKSNPIQTAKA